MSEWKIKDIAKAVNGKIVAGDGEVTVSAFSTDSRNADSGAMFVPIIGERVDGHDYIAAAWKNGMKATFTSREGVQENTEGMVYVQVEDTVAALQRFGRSVRDAHRIPLVGITGSVGKTTTKEMVAAALETGFHTLKTAGNMNSQVGVPQMMLRLEDSHEIAVIEMGMSLPGEMARLAFVACPDIAILTNIGVSHIGQLGSQENIRREKLCIINEMREGGVLLLNGDDPLLAQLYQCPEQVDMLPQTRQKLAGLEIITYGLGSECDFRAMNVRTENERLYFTACHNTADSQEKQDIELLVTGEHNVRNALAALAVAVKRGLTMAQAAQGLSRYQPIAMRGGKIKVNGMVLIDDTYNASPDSMRGGIDTLMAVSAGRHIAVLADMLELGDLSKACHEQVGAYAAQSGVDILVTIGTQARYMAQAAAGIAGAHFDTNAQALAYLKEQVKEGDAVLFKGSRGMHLEELVKGLQ